MEALPLTLLFLFLSFILSSNTVTSKWVSGIRNIGAEPDSNRRILHEPLFPVGSAPPPAVEPPPPENSDIPDPDHPFFPEVPTGLSPGQTQTTPTQVNISTTPAPLATQPANSTKKYGIAISAGIVTLGMLSALVFYLYRHRAKHPSETQKLVGGNSQQEPSEPASDCLYLGTMEPSNQRRSGEVNGIKGSSSYHKLGSVRMSEQYQPSPELQPMPQLNRAPSRTSPPSMSSDDDTFYTSHDSSVGNGEIRYTTTQRQIPQSRSSPKSRFSISSPEVKHAIVQTSTPPPPPPPPALLLPTQQPRRQYSQPRTPSPPKRKAKFPSPASPPTDLVLPPAPPPPPPPPTTATPWKVRHSEISASKNQIQALPKTQPQMPNTKATTRAEIPTPIAEVKQCGSSTEPLNMGEDVILAKPRLKPLHWDKVRATSDRATVWDQLKSSSFKLNEDMIESLFGCNSTNQAQKEPTTKSIHPPVQQEERVLDPKKSQNIAILLRALNVTRDEVSEALLDGNPEHLGPELLETMVKMAPTKEEELKLRDYGGELSKLGSAERFLKALLDIPFAFKRVDAMLYRANFDTEVKYLRKSFETLEAACEELKNSRLFLKLLEAVLRTGNRMNVGTNRGDAKAFKLDTLLKLVEVKGTDGKTTLLHFVVQEIIRSEGEGSNSKPENLLNKMHPKMEEENFNKQGLQVVAGLSRDLGNIKKAAGMDSDVLRGYLTKLEMGLGKVRMVLQYEKSNTQGKFFEAMKLFLNEAEEEILQVKADEKKALSLVKEVTEYFHGDTVKEGAHPFRIFMIVRDFLSVLDQVCKEVRKMQEGAIMGSARSFRISASVSLPVLNRFNTKQDSSAEDSLSP